MAQNLLPGRKSGRDPVGDEIEMDDRRDSILGDDQHANGQNVNDLEAQNAQPVADPPANPVPARHPDDENVNADPDIEAAVAVADNNNNEVEEEDNPHPDALRYAFVALIAAILLLALLTLQIYALYASITGLHKKDLKVNWCSPSFRDFALAVSTGNCQHYPVLPSSSNGIGCIALPGTQQTDWLRGTAIALTVALFCQTADWVLMMCTNSESRWRGVKFQRPWLTMAAGVIVLVVLIYAGRVNANELPEGVTRTVWIYRKEESSALGRVCKGELDPPGLRGTMIGYMDGLFQSWGGVYDGH